MITLVTILHIAVSIGLVLVVLLQTGKGADMGAVFGGSSSTVFGSSGAGNFLTRLTTGMAVIFMITSITLGYFAGKPPSGSVFDAGSVQSPPPAAAPAPQAGSPQSVPSPNPASQAPRTGAP